MIYPLTIKNFGDVDYVIAFLNEKLSEYDLPGLSGDNIGTVPISDAHPLSMVFASMVNLDGKADTSMLPAIGVDLLDNGENERQFVGQARRKVQIKEDLLTSLAAMTMKQRKEAGYIIPESILTTLLALFEDIDPAQSLWGTAQDILKFTNLSVAVWAPDKTVARILGDVTLSILERMKMPMASVGCKGVKISTTGGLYNYDFDRTLYGVEHQITYTNPVCIIEVDPATLTITNVDETFTMRGGVGGTDTKSTSLSYDLVEQGN